MPSDKTPGASNTSKRVRTESARKREGRENAEALQRERAGQKAAAKARKETRDEAAGDNILVEREGESPELTKLRVYTLRLETDNQRMKAKLSRREEQDDSPPIKMIPAPPNKGDIDVELLRHHLGLLGEENDVKWSKYRKDFRAVLIGGNLDWNQPWSKQEFDRVNTIYHAAEIRRPEMKRFANHWGTEFLLKESFGNLYFYHQKLVAKNPDMMSGGSKKRRTHPHSRTDNRDHDDQPDDVPMEHVHEEPRTDNRDNVQTARARRDPRTDNRDEDVPTDRARSAAAHKAAAYRSAERKAAKRKADTQGNELDNRRDEDGVPYNDGETEIEDLPDETRKAITRDEIAKSKLPVKKPAKPNPLGPAGTEAEASSMPLPKVGTDPSIPKSRPVIFLKHGRGGKVQHIGRGRDARQSVRESPSASSSRDHRDDPGDDDVVSLSSGQTSSGTDD